MDDRQHPREKIKNLPRAKRVQYLLEYAGFIVLKALVIGLKREWARKLGRFSGRVAWKFDKRHRKMALYNTAAAFLGEKKIAETREIARNNFIHLGETAIDLIKSTEMKRENKDRFFTFENTDIVERELEILKKTKNGAIALSAHLGSQEMLVGHVLKYGIGKETIITKRIRNPYIDYFVQTQREKLGVKVLPHRGSGKEVVKRITNGEIIVFLLDQRASYHEGVKCRFFGRPVVAHKSVAQLALAFDLQVVPLFPIKQPDGRYNMIYLEKLDLPKTGDMDRDTKTLTQMFQDVIEQMVRKYPEQWWWAHDRWKRAEEMPDD